jgi:hypothetical protein
MSVTAGLSGPHYKNKHKNNNNNSNNDEHTPTLFPGGNLIFFLIILN